MVRGGGGATLGFGQLRVLQLAIDFPPVSGSFSDSHAVRLGDDGQDGYHLAQLCHEPAIRHHEYAP